VSATVLRNKKQKNKIKIINKHGMWIILILAI
jgi:hypothetical protein